MLSTAASLILIGIAVLFSVCDAELRISDILNAELLPSTLLLEGNITRRSISDSESELLKWLPEKLTRRPGNWTLAFSTMDFHRKMMNEYLCRNFVAEQILEDMSQPLEAKASAWTSPKRSSDSVMKLREPSPFVLSNASIAQDGAKSTGSSDDTTQKIVEDTKQDSAQDRMDTVDPSTETSSNADNSTEMIISEARSAPMFRKKSSASLKKTRRKKKKNNDITSGSNRRRTDISKPNMLADPGSAAYKDWLTRTALLEDIYRHYDHLAIPSEESPSPASQSPAPVEEVIAEDSSHSAAVNINSINTAAGAVSAVDSTAGASIPNLSAYEGGEVTGFAITQGNSYPVAQSIPQSVASITNHGAATLNLRPVQFPQPQPIVNNHHNPVRPSIQHHHHHISPVAASPIPVQATVNAASSASVPHLSSPPVVSTAPFPALGRFPAFASLPTSLGLPSLATHSFTSVQSPPTIPTGLPVAAYGDRGGAFPQYGDVSTAYESPPAPTEEHHHHHHVEHHDDHSKAKLLSLEDLFDLVLTAIAFLAFGAFVVHLIMCLLSDKQHNYYPWMEVPMSAPGPGTIPGTGAASAASGVGRKRRRRDAVTGGAGMIVDGAAPAALDRAAASVITSIDAALLHIREKEKDEKAEMDCLLRAICAHNRRSRSAPGMLRVWMPVWSLGLSWVVGRNTTHPASNTLANLRAAILGLSGTRCRSAFPRCSPPPTTSTTPTTSIPTTSTSTTTSTTQRPKTTMSRPTGTGTGTKSTVVNKRRRIKPLSGDLLSSLPDEYRYPVGPPGVGSYTRFTPIAVKTNRPTAPKRRKKKP